MQSKGNLTAQLSAGAGRSPRSSHGSCRGFFNVLFTNLHKGTLAFDHSKEQGAMGSYRRTWACPSRSLEKWGPNLMDCEQSPQGSMDQTVKS